MFFERRSIERHPFDFVDFTHSAIWFRDETVLVDNWLSVESVRVAEKRAQVKRHGLYMERWVDAEVRTITSLKYIRIVKLHGLVLFKLERTNVI